MSQDRVIKKQMQVEIVSDTPMMLDDDDNKTLGVSSLRKEALQSGKTQEIQCVAIVDIPIMTTENYSKMVFHPQEMRQGGLVKHKT